jgi:hypothetical protein
MAGTFCNSLPVSPTHCTRASSNMTELSTSVLHNKGTYCSRTTTGSPISMSSGYKMLEREASLENQRNGDVQVFPAGVANTGRHVGDGMRDGALTRSQIVTSHMSARSAAATLTLVPSASCKVPPVDRWARRPRYVRDLVWADNEPPRVTLAAWIESALPLPSPPCK